MRELYEMIKKHFISAFVLLFIGFYWGTVYTRMNISTDCKILGMFRIGAYGYGCQASKVSGE